MKIKKLFKIFYTFGKNVKRLNIDAYAACTAFFLILSIIPMMILLCSILPFTPITEENLVTFLQDLVPDIFNHAVERLVSSVYSGGYAVLTFSIILTIWTAGKGMSSIVQGLNAINGVEEKRNYFHIRSVCALYTLVFITAIFLSLLFMVFGQQLSDYLVVINPRLEDLQTLIIKPRYLYLFIILSFIFTFMFSFLPNKKQKFKEQLPGGVLCSAAWLIFSFGFSMYVTHFNPFNMYGSLAMIVVAMFWMYFCMLIMFYCAYLNRYFKPINIVIVYPQRRKDLVVTKDGRLVDKNSLPPEETQDIKLGKTAVIQSAIGKATNELLMQTEAEEKLRRELERQDYLE